jgi:hypothetical protein
MYYKSISKKRIHMKKLITIAALSATLASQTFAGDREWATVGKVLTGVVAIEAIGRIVNPPTQVVYVQPQPVVYAQPVVVQPQPVVYYQPAPVVYYQPQPAVVVYGGWGRPVHHYHHHHH